MPQTGASQYATQQARPRLISRDPTFFVIWIETQGDRVLRSGIRWLHKRSMPVSLQRNERSEGGATWRSVTFAPKHVLEVTQRQYRRPRAFHAQRMVDVAGYGAWDGLSRNLVQHNKKTSCRKVIFTEKGWIAAAAVELCVSDAASRAGIGSESLVMIVFALPTSFVALPSGHRAPRVYDKAEANMTSHAGVRTANIRPSSPPRRLCSSGRRQPRTRCTLGACVRSPPSRNSD